MGAYNTILYNGQSGGLGTLSVGNVIIYRALRLARVLQGPSQGPSPEKLADGLIALNGLLDYLTAQQGAIYTKRQDRYTLQPSQVTYTIGIDPTGQQTANFNAVRPVRIDRASLVLTGTNPPVFLPMSLLTPEEWASLVVRTIPTTVPRRLYCDYANPISTLYFWGYPTAGNDVELWTWQQLAQFQTIDDQVTLPPAYLDMLVYNLAVRLSEMFGTNISSSVLLQARQMLGRVKALNNPSPQIASADFGRQHSRPDFNYFSGGPN